MRYQERLDLLSKVPGDWERVAKQLVHVAGKGVLRYVRYDGENFGSCIVVLRYRLVSIRFIKDRSDEWVDVKSALGRRWIPLSEFVGKRTDGRLRLVSMFDSVMYIENVMLSWPRKKWYSASIQLLFK